MSVITIKVETVDRTDKIDPLSFSLNRALTNQADTLSFTIQRTQASDWKPSLLDEIEVLDTDGVTKLFAGTIIVINEKVEMGVEYVDCQCRDWTFEMDRKLVTRVYEGETINDIIADINSSFLTGFTVANVSCPLVIDYIAFNYEYPSKCIQQLAQLVSYDWYVDSAKDIHFFGATTELSPFDLNDDDGKYFLDSLIIKQDATKIKNTITVRGGEYLGSSYSETYIADGSQISFPLVNRYNGISVTVNGVSKTVGIDNLNDPVDYDCLYNFQEKSLKFRVATKPSATHPVVVTGLPYIPVLSKRYDTASIASYGTFEFKIIDNSINTKAGALERAGAEIGLYGDALDEGSFSTKESGLEVGQLINIQSTLRGLDQDFIITRITSNLNNPDYITHNVTITTTQTFGMVEFLQKLLMEKDKEIKIAVDEVLDVFLGFSETLESFTDEVTDISTNSAPYTYDGGANDGVWGFSTWS